VAMNNEEMEMLKFIQHFLNEYRIFIILVAVLIVIILLIFKFFLSYNITPEPLKSLFGIGRDYRNELKNIVNQSSEMQGLTWVFGDYYNIISKGEKITSRIVYKYYSYIIAFGNNKLVIIPVDIQEDKMIAFDPININKNNLLHIVYSDRKKLTEINISGKIEKIRYYVYDKIIKEVNIEDIVKKIDNKTGANMQEWVYEVNQEIKFAGRINLEQKEEQNKYKQFIKQFNPAGASGG
jgi:hypothetical protein